MKAPHLFQWISKISKIVFGIFSGSVILSAQESPMEYQWVRFDDSTYLRSFHGIQFNIPITLVPSRFTVEDDSTLKFENLRQWTGFLPAYVRGFQGGRHLKVGITHLFHHRQSAYEDSIPLRYDLKGGAVYASYDLHTQFFGEPPFTLSWFIGADLEAAYRHINWQHMETWQQTTIQANVGVEWGIRWFPTHQFYLEIWMEPVSIQLQQTTFNQATTRDRSLRRGIVRFAAGFHI